MERDPYYETTEEWGYDEDVDGCLHGIPFDEPCWYCGIEEDALDWI